MKKRHLMEERMVSLVEDTEFELLEGIEKEVLRSKEANAELEFARKDPIKELEKYMVEVRERLGRDKAHKFFVEALDELVPGQKKKNKF